MPTGLSSTELPGALASEWRAVGDLLHLLRFRAATVPRRRALLIGASFLVLTAAAAAVPAYLPGAGELGPGRARDALSLLPTAFAGFQLLTLVAAVASGGGRELVPREQLAAYPMSPTTDHLGALLLAPLNVAWLLQSWTLLATAAYGLGPARWLPGTVAVLLWIAAATATAQVVGWSVEGVRRRPYGIALVRGLALAGAALGAWLQLTHRLGPLLDTLPTRWFVIGLIEGVDGRWVLTLAAELGILVAAVVLGAVPAHLAARVMPRDESDADAATYAAGPIPRSDLAMLVRVDRASVWRAVPMRRGLMVLSIGPGVVALAGALTWSQLILLPGLVASGGALLFAVNAWCLDGRGGLWRESLPVAPRVVFAARAWVCAEFITVASAITLAIGCLRAGVPDLADIAAVVAGSVAVLLHVVSAAMRWSQAHPYSADLHSARATPAPPLAMIAYSSKLAASTTVIALLFSGLIRLEAPALALALGMVMSGWSCLRLSATAGAWADPSVRARVVTTVAL